VIVVKAPTRSGELRCGGTPMIAFTESATTNGGPADGARDGTLLGKRYVAPDIGIEVLCTQPGQGSLAFDDTPLTVQGPRPLPPSD
jgi:hypothetical protein